MLKSLLAIIRNMKKEEVDGAFLIGTNPVMLYPDRQFVKEVQRGGITPPNLEEYFGYGIYAGKKPEREA